MGQKRAKIVLKKQACRDEYYDRSDHSTAFFQRLQDQAL